MTKVVRDNSNIIMDDLHKTLPIMTKYEYTRILGQRAMQINNGSKPYIEVSDNIIDGYVIAQKEILEKKIPIILSIKRTFLASSETSFSELLLLLLFIINV